MLMIEDGIITLTRGDTAALEVALITQDGTAYTMQEGDTLTITVRERADPESEVLMAVTSQDNTLVLPHQQTKAMPVGSLSYDIQLNTASGDVFTVLGARGIGKSLRNFVVLPEVTMDG